MTKPTITVTERATAHGIPRCCPPHITPIDHRPDWRVDDEPAPTAFYAAPEAVEAPPDEGEPERFPWGGAWEGGW